MKMFLYNFHQDPVTSILIDQDIFLSILFSNTFSQHYSRNVTPSVTPISNAVQNFISLAQIHSPSYFELLFCSRKLYSCQLFYYLWYTLEIKERFTTDQITTIKQIQEERWENNIYVQVYHLFFDFHQSYNFSYRTRHINNFYEFVAQDQLFRLVRAKCS